MSKSVHAGDDYEQSHSALGVFNPHDQRKLWAETLETKMRSTKKIGSGNMIRMDSFTMFQDKLKYLESRYSSNRLPSLLGKLRPVYERLNAFSKAITVFAQSDPTYSCLVWGAILTVLEVASRFSKILDRIASMFDHMTEAMPRFESYSELYPNSTRLQSSLREIYSQYIDFCINALRFFRYKPCCRLLTLMWSNMSFLFDETTQAIKEGADNFEAEARLAHDIAAAEHREKMERMLTQLSNTSHGPQSCFCMPFTRNGRFFGREKELRHIHTVLNPPNQQNSCTIHGIAGIGKTQLAVEYSYRYASQSKGYKYIFWLHAQDDGVLTDDFGVIAQHLNLGPNISQDTSHKIQLVRQWFCDNSGWLLVFDNVNDIQDLNRFWPASMHGAILVTSQLSELGRRTTSELCVSSLSDDEGSGLLLRQILSKSSSELSPQTIRETRMISSEVGGMPLLLDSLAGYIKQSHRSLREVLGVLNKSPRKDARRMLSNGSTSSVTFQYEKPMRRVYELALKVLPDVARNVLKISAMLSPDKIEEYMFLRDFKSPSLDWLSNIQHNQFVDDVRFPLTKRNLVTIHQSGPMQETIHYSIHRALQRNLLDELDADPEQRQRTFECTVALLQSHLPRPSPIMVPLQDQWDLYEPIIPHVTSLHHVYTTSEPRIEGTLQLAELLCNTAAYMFEKGIRKFGLSILKTAEGICSEFAALPKPIIQQNVAKLSLQHEEALRDTSKFLTAPSLECLQANILAYAAGIHWTLGGISTRVEAHGWTQKVVELREQHLLATMEAKRTVPDHLLLSNSYNDFAIQLLDEERYLDAESWIVKSLEIKYWLRDQGESIPQFEFAESFKSLSFVRLVQRRYTEAIDIVDEAVRRTADDEGQSSISTLLFKFYSAVVRLNVGQTRESLDIHHDVLEARLRLLGETSNDTLHSLFAVGQIYYRTQIFHEAEKCLQICVKKADDAQWPSECIFRAQYQLSLVFRAVRNEEEADKLARLAIEGRNNLLQDCAISPQLPSTEEDEMRLFDSMVNHQAGRSTIMAFSKIVHKASDP